MSTTRLAEPSTARPAAPQRTRGRARRGRTQLWIWAFLTPTVLLYGLYTVYPIGASYWYSLLDWNGFDAQKSFVGLANYREVLGDPLFWNTFKITLLFTVVTVPVKVFSSLLVAILLNSPKMPFRGLFRTALFLPVVTTTAIVGIVMQFVFDPASGPINLLLVKLGLLDEGVNFLGSSSTALWTVVGVYVWKWFGVTLIYWLAALQTIPDEVYEAARIDGASAWNLMRRITLPLLKPFTIIITLLTLESTLKIFDLVLTMTRGGPYYATEVVEIYIYRWAFAATVPRLGYASAAAVIFGLFVCLVGMLQLLGVRAARRAGSMT
ncbi:MAG: sugar ABC transporter permease [Actinocatenispora sp.]